MLPSRDDAQALTQSITDALKAASPLYASGQRQPGGAAVTIGTPEIIANIERLSRSHDALMDAVERLAKDHPSLLNRYGLHLRTEDYPWEKDGLSAFLMRLAGVRDRLDNSGTFVTGEIRGVLVEATAIGYALQRVGELEEHAGTVLAASVRAALDRGGREGLRACE